MLYDSHGSDHKQCLFQFNNIIRSQSGRAKFLLIQAEDNLHKTFKPLEHARPLKPEPLSTNPSKSNL